MGLRIYNTLTRRVEPFEPLQSGRVTMYTCGPTVWNYAHVGNFRTFLFEDLLRRYLEFLGYEVFQIMNLTDVDDRTIKAAAEAGLRLEEHTKGYIEAFFQDCEYLRVKPASTYPRATESIDAMIELVGALLDRGLAYRSLRFGKPRRKARDLLRRNGNRHLYFRNKSGSVGGRGGANTR